MSLIPMPVSLTSLNPASPIGKWLRLAALLAAVLCAPSAHALCTLVCSCNVTTTSLLFGNYNPLSPSNVDSTGKLTVSCGGVAGLAIPYTVTLSAGLYGPLTARAMGSGTNRLLYNVFTTNARTTIFGDGSGTTGVGSGNIPLDLLGLSPPQDTIVYGRIPGSQASVPPGNYSDTLVVTLTYF